MPGHSTKSSDRDEISETASTNSTHCGDEGSRGDWETVSNHSTTTSESHTPLASPGQSPDPTAAKEVASKREKPDKPHTASRSSAKPKSNATESLSAEQKTDRAKGRDTAGEKDKNRSRGKTKHAPAPGRTTLEEYFHQQSKLFSNLEKRYNAFQQKVKDERERQRKNRGRR